MFTIHGADIFLRNIQNRPKSFRLEPKIKNSKYRETHPSPQPCRIIIKHIRYIKSPGGPQLSLMNFFRNALLLFFFFQIKTHRVRVKVGFSQVKVKKNSISVFKVDDEIVMLFWYEIQFAKNSLFINVHRHA